MATVSKVQMLNLVMGRKLAAFLYFALSAAVVVNASSAKAAEDYSLKIQSSFAISDSCDTENGPQKSQIELLVDTVAPSTDVKALTNAAARVKVCSPFVDPISKTLPIPLPVALMKQSDKMAVGAKATFPLNNPRLKALFTDGDAPDTLVVTKTQANIFELRYNSTKSGDTKIGPIRATLSPNEMRAVPGYIANSLPITYIEVDVQEQNVTLKADIQSMKSLVIQNLF